MSELLPCPFCGSSNVTDEKNANNWPIIQCADCGACGPCIDIDTAKATERWNTRAAPLPDREAWQPIETAGDDNMILLVCNPDEGTLPVLAWKIETTWYEYGIYGKPLRPPPKYWMKCPTMPRISNHEQEAEK